MQSKKKWDGHTHSEFCGHGSGQKTARMVERAIRLGFEQYSVTEHAPLPEGVVENPQLRQEFGLLDSQLDDYFQHLQDLKRVYANRIEILVGLEVDFFAGREKDTRELITSRRHQLDDLILSLHFLPVGKNFKGIDYSPALFASELIGAYGSVDAVHRAYWENIQKMVSMGGPLPRRKRIGHVGLINKYIRKFPLSSAVPHDTALGEMIFRLIKSNQWAIDFNVGGIDQVTCRDVYLDRRLLTLCRQHDIELVYGSDAHGEESIGRHYHRFEEVETHLHSGSAQ